MENLKQTCKNSAKLPPELCTLFLPILTNTRGNIKLLMDLFDKIIVLICTYKQWGGVCLLYKTLFLPLFLSENQQKNPEKILFFRHLLGINSHSTNWAVLSETSSKPILCKIILKTGCYCTFVPPFFYWCFWCRISCWLRII